MQKIFPTLFVFGLTLAISACGQEQPAATITPLPSQTPFPAVLETALPDLPALPTLVEPTATVTSAPPLLSFSPILFRVDGADRYYSFQLLGGYLDGIWLDDDATFARMAFRQPHDLYTPDGYLGVFHPYDATTEAGPPYHGATYVGSDFSQSQPLLFGFSQGWRVTARPIQELEVDSDLYRQAVRDWLQGQGLAEPNVQIQRIARVDLEGDGVDEVFIAATYFKTPNPLSPLVELGDYSIVLLRKVSGNEVLTLPLAADVYHNAQAEAGYPLTYELLTFLDLNQDGVLEMILNVTRWEGSGVIVYEFKNGTVIEVLREVAAE